MGRVGTARSVGGNVALTTVVVVVGWVAAFVAGAAAADGTLKSDAAVLRAVVTSNPTFNQSWIGDDPCGWHRVYCSKSRVTEINFFGYNLRGSIPKEIGNLTSLQYLDLSRNQLSGSIPKELGSLKSLQTLSLSENQLSGSIPKELASLTFLESLYLDFNQLSGPIPKELDNLTSLQTLSLGHNKLNSSIPKELGSLTLRHLDLASNQLSGSIPEELDSLIVLRSLRLDSNQLSGSIPKELGLTFLTHLNLSSNQLSGSIPKELGSLTYLTSLYLNFNRLSGPIPRELGNLTSLEYLYLDSNQLSGPIPKELDRLRYPIVLGCINHMTTEDLYHVCTSTTEDGGRRFVLSECQSKCLPASPKTVAAVLWSAWLGIAALIAISVFFVSQRCRPPVGEEPDDVNVDITKIGICKYAWGLLSLAFILFDVITNFQTLRALVGSWSLYVVAALMVWQHLISGLMLYMECVRKQSWPLALGLCTMPMKWSWAWEWRRCIVGFKGSRTIGAEGRDIRRDSILHLLLWPLGLVYVILLDVLSLLSLKIGFQLKVGSEWVNLHPYWASRELTDALFQALPQAVFQTVLMVSRADPKETKIRITTSQFVLSVSSSLGSVIAVLAMAFWEARMKRQNVAQELWHQFKGILPVVGDDDGGWKSTSDPSKTVIVQK